MAKIKSV